MAKLTSSYPHTTNNFQPQNLFFFRENHCETTYSASNSKFKTREGGKKDGEREHADVTREEVTTMAWQHQMYGGK